MSRRRFLAPRRDAVDPDVFGHPIFDGYAAYRDWFIAPQWPSFDLLNAAMALTDKRFVPQDAMLFEDGMHYEARIGECGGIATRAENWHDLFNAAVWCRYPHLKLAFNARQRAHIAVMGAAERNRAQYALTQFDEAGVIVCIRDPALLALWDRHDWLALFHAKADDWRRGDIRIAAVIGHALLEHALMPELYPVGKCLVVQGELSDVDCVSIAADAIARGAVLNDPLELRPLPLAGIPGWHPAQDVAFYTTAGCFQPVRVGRVYPQVLSKPERRLEPPSGRY